MRLELQKAVLRGASIAAEPYAQRSENEQNEHVTTDINQHGLRRDDLTEDIRRTVRRRCGFGCVVCGSVPYHYDHFDPPFSEAREHRAEGITLLCARCHDLVSRRVWSREKVRKHDRSPFGKKERPHLLLDLQPPARLVIGTIVFEGDGRLLTVGGVPLISLHSLDGEGVLLSAEFRDADGNQTISVRNNELLFCQQSWDITVRGSRVRVHRAPRDVIFDAILLPPNAILVKSIDVQCGRSRIQSNSRDGARLTVDGHEPIVGATVLVTQGELMANEAGFQLTGPSCFLPYPADRFSRLTAQGKLDRALKEAFGPVLRVVSFRKSRAEPPNDWLQPVPGAPSGKVRYRRFCDVCACVIAFSDCDPGSAPRSARAGLLCATCAQLKPDEWHVTVEETVLQTHPAWDAAEKAARQALWDLKMPWLLIQPETGTTLVHVFRNTG
jgi:hypothetical protein